MNSTLRLEMRGVRRSFGATKALRGVELSVVPGVSWTAVASEARNRFWPGAFVVQNVLSRPKAPSSLRFAGAVQNKTTPGEVMARNSSWIQPVPLLPSPV